MRYKLCSKSQLENLQVIHYGSNIYTPIRPVVNGKITKPRGGLWTSPVYSDWSWKHWCREENFRKIDESVSFKLGFKLEAKILIINSIKDLEVLPKRKDIAFELAVDFEKLAKKYDGIWLTEVGEKATRFSESLDLWGWDVETVLIFNSDCCYLI